jgi:hypothetical protein
MATPTNLPAAFVASNVLNAAQMNDLRGAFRILKIASASYSSQTGNSTGTYAASGLSAFITPQATTNSVMITGTVSASTSQAGAQLGLRLVREIGGTSTVLQTWTYALYNSAGFSYALIPFTVLETPSTTSACTYRIEFALTGGGGTVYTQVGNISSNIILQEVSG